MRDIFLKNIGLKILSLLFSVALWFYITTEKESEIGFSVKLKVKNIPEEMELVSRGNFQVTVWVYGLRRHLMSISNENIFVPVDLKNAKEGITLYPISLESIQVPSDIRVTKVSPAIVRFQLESIVKARVKVFPNLKGELPLGYEIEKVEEEPKFIDIKGIRSIVEGLKGVNTYPIDITGVSESTNFEVPIDDEGSKINVANGKKMVRVEVEVREKIIEKVFTDMPAVVENLKELSRAVVTPEKGSLTVKGPEAILHNINEEEDIKIILDGKTLNPGQVAKKKAKVILPERIILLKLEPEWFKVKLE